MGNETKRGLSPHHEQFVERDGASVCLQTWGDKDLPPILILDGIGCSGWAFRQITPLISERYRVALMHYRGHGNSPDPPRPWRLSMHDLADDAAACIEALGRPALVLGFSMGFQVALELYKRHRPQVAGLVSLAGPAGRVLAQFQGTDLFSKALPAVRAATRLASGLSSRLWRSVVPSTTLRDLGLPSQVNTNRIDVEDIDFYLSQMAQMSPELFMDTLGEATRHSTDDLLSRIRTPTLIMAGGKDRFVPLATMRQVAFSIPGAAWVVLEQASHALPAEYPEEVAAHLLEFTDTVFT